MTATPTKTARHQLDEMLVRLEAKAEQLLQAELWDEEQIEATAKYRYTFAEVIGRNETTLANYLSEGCCCCCFTREEQANGIPSQADQWVVNDQVADGFVHDYLSQYCEEHVPYLPEGWLEIPRYEFDWNVQPLTGEKMLDLLYDHTSVQDAGELLEVDVLGDDRKLCGEALVRTGYLTNQENLTGDDQTVLQSNKLFSKVLKEALVDVEEG
ncbi:hypothetical protein [Synechococcus sp. A15-44]|uniref:hypothetical protein n=1 Tax=Synechococcus sp. A15-44 TaxID=1050646 RepID=UPI00164793A9|nr:hypothetical protein [Synechococcus sp. A15-44]QNI64961.1 hypothetical protein SynA1544_02028 [Synechococcus sp. A15-44]